MFKLIKFPIFGYKVSCVKQGHAFLSATKKKKRKEKGAIVMYSVSLMIVVGVIINDWHVYFIFIGLNDKTLY